MSMDAHPSLPQGYKDHPANFRNPYLSQPAFHPLNPNGIYLGSTVSQNLSYGPMYQGFFPNHPGSQVGYQNPPSFMFRERKGRVNWRNIASLDVDEMIGKGDIRMLESYLSNICFANLEKEDIEAFEDVNLLKLFRLSQYGLEYLLNCQNYLANQAQALEYQYKISDEQFHPLEEQARRNHEEIMRLKNEIGEKKSLLSSYHNTLSTPIYKCHLCTKLFKSQEFLNKHFQTRHESALAKEKKNDHDAILEAQKQNAFLIEKLMLQLKENEDLKLSQMTSALQNRLQEVVQSNKELTAKVAEMEKKMESEATSPDQPFNRTIRRENPQIQTGESLNEIQSRQTPKKPVSFDRNGSPSKQAFHAGDLLQDDETKTHDRQTFKAGSLKDVEDEEKHRKQAFKAGSLKDLEDEEEGEIRQIDSIGKLSSKKRVTRQAFRSGDLEDSDDTEDKRNSNKVSEKQAFKAGSLQDLDEEEPKSHNVQNITNSRGKQAFKRQTFFSGDLENEQVPKNIQNFNAGTLENDQDEVKSRKRSQEDFVIVEEQEEEEAFEHKKDRKKSQEQKHRPTEEVDVDVDEDEIREQHKNAMIKAKNLIKNKYRHPITQEEYENAEKEVSKDLKKKSKQILEVKYKKIEEQDLEDLSNMQKKLKNLNKKDMKHFEEIEQEYQYISSQPMQKPTGKERYDQEVKAESPRNKNKLAQSSELMNLIVDSERKGKGGKTSIETAAKKKQIFESQSLENQLASVEDIKKSRNQGYSNAQSVRESGTNLLKKSIQYRDPEDL